MKYFLIVRQQNNQLGDLLCSAPMYFAIKKKYPESHITLVTASTNYDIPFKLINPHIDTILKLKRDSIVDYRTFIKEMRRTKYDFGIVPSTLMISRISNIINFISGAKIRVGVKRIDSEINKYHFLLNIKKEFDWNKNKVHQIYRISDIVKQIGCELSNQEIEEVKINISEEDKRFADEFISCNFPDLSKPLIGLHPGAGKSGNRWDVKHYFELIKLIHRSLSKNILITSGQIDKDVTNKLVNHLRENSIRYVLAENLDIGKLAAVQKKLNLYITNDTGIMHLAGFLGVNIISLFGPTNGFEWAPLKKNQFYIQSKTGNINDIEVKEVFDLILKKYDQW